MKRIVYSCFFLLFLFLSGNIFSQSFQGTVTPQVLCYNPAGNSATAAVTVPSAGANTYSWTIANPTSGSSTQTTIPASAPGTPSAIAITFSGCGQYTLVCRAYVNGNPIPTDVFQITADVVCPAPATITAASSSICAGAVAGFTAAGAATWTWNPGNITTPTIAVTPTTSTCYTVTGTTAQGCSVQAVSCVTVQNINVAVSPPTSTICSGLTLTLTANATAGPLTNVTYQWYNTTAGPPPVALGTSSTQVVSPTITSTYSVLATVSTCTASATNTVTIGPALSIFITSSSASVCPSESFTLTGASSAINYTWTPPSPFTSTSTVNPATFTTGPGIYSVTGTNGTCEGTATIQIFPTAFTPSVSASSLSVCPNENFTLTGLGGGVTSTYIWGSVVFNPLPVITPIATGVSSIQVTQTVATIYGFSVTSPAGCVGTATTNIGITPPVTVTAISSANSVCATSPVTLTATGGNGAATYTWVSSVTGTISTSSPTVVDNPAVATTYSVYASNASGFCTSTPYTLTVNMISGGTLTLTTSASNSTICPNNQSTLTASGAINYTWSPAAAILNGSVNGSTVIASPSVTTTYSVYGDNGGGCSNTATITVVVSAIPTLSTNASAYAVCAGYTSTLTATGATSYTWTGSTLSTPINQASVSVSPGTTLSPATYTVIGGSAGANCPSLPVVVSVSLAPNLNVAISQDQYTTCINDNYPTRSKPVNLQASGATNYAWSPYNPLYMTYPLGPNTTVRPPTTTQYTVTGSTAVCSGTAYVNVIVIPQFTIDVSPPLPFMCLNDTLRLTIVNIGTLAVGPASAYTYSWADPPTSPPPSITQTSGTISVLAFPQVTSTYTVGMWDSRGCASIPRLVTVTVLPQPITAISIPTINNVATNTVCFVGDIPSAPDNTVVLTAINGNTGLPFGVTQTYTWISPYNPTSILTDPNNAQVTVNAPTRLPAVVVYTLNTGYNGIAGCSRVDTVSIRVIDCRPIVSNSVSFTTDVAHDTLCARDCITFIPLTDTVAGGPQTYTWTFTGGSPYISHDKTPTVCYNLPGKFNVALEVGNPYPLSVPGSKGYYSSFQFTRVVDIPNVTIIPPGQLASDTIVKFGQSVVLTATNAVSYAWSPPYNISALTGSVVTVNPIKTTQYIVTGYNSSHCFSTDTVNVIVIEDCGEMYVPNAFSPNGDGVNDVLQVRGICLQTLTFMIFDRWGEKVFETTNVEIGWDGTFHGEKMNTGVFVYRLEGKTYSGKGFSSKGNITLIR